MKKTLKFKQTTTSTWKENSTLMYKTHWKGCLGPPEWSIFSIDLIFLAWKMNDNIYERYSGQFRTYLSFFKQVQAFLALSRGYEQWRAGMLNPSFLKRQGLAGVHELLHPLQKAGQDWACINQASQSQALILLKTQGTQQIRLPSSLLLFQRTTRNTDHGVRQNVQGTWSLETI